MQVAALAALEPAKLLAKRCECAMEAIGAAPRPRPTQHGTLERCDGARVRAFGRTQPDQWMLEQREQRHWRKAFDHGLRGKPREYAGRGVGERIAARVIDRDAPARQRRQHAPG